MRRVQQSLDALALRGADAALSAPGWRVVRQFHDVKHQRRRFVAGVVGAVTEDTRARAAGDASTLARCRSAHA